MTVSNGFGQDQTHYTVTIKWKNGFTHSYEQMLNDKQLISEQDRFKTYRWIESVNFFIIDKLKIIKSTKK